MMQSLKIKQENITNQKFKKKIYKQKGNIQANLMI